MQVERVVIDGCPYRIQPLKRNGNLINLTGYLRAGKQITLLHVKGDSMNLLVRDGEYVLIILQSEAADGDIVVAGFVGEETEATLKRYYRRWNQITLEPVSDNPVHQSRTIEAGKPGFKIIGVALAALTPVDA
jgi:repressor LexA